MWYARSHDHILYARGRDLDEAACLAQAEGVV